MLTQRQSGFTLVELMVAMVIGTVIILGAGQLFLTTFQTFQKVAELSRKQETVVFAANRLINEYRKGKTYYGYGRTRDSNGNELDECSIMEDSQPIVGGLALYEGQCDEGRLMESEVEVAPDEPLEGYYSFTLDFKRADDELETLSFHVMEREMTLSSGTADQQYQVSTGDAIIAGGSMSGVRDDLLQGESRTSDNIGSHNIPDPRSNAGQSNYTSYIENFKELDDVVSTCDSTAIATSSATHFYCGGNINNLNVDGLDGRVIVAENGVSIEQNENASVNDLAVVAGGAININGNNDNTVFDGLVWSAGSSNLSASGVDFQGSVVSGGAVSVNNASSITADQNKWDLLSVSGYDFSMVNEFSKLGAPINEAEVR